MTGAGSLALRHPVALHRNETSGSATGWFTPASSTNKNRQPQNSTTVLKLSGVKPTQINQSIKDDP